MDRIDIIKAYISSSELNRMRKHGIELTSYIQGGFNKEELFETGTLTKKLKRKLNLLFSLGVLEYPKKPLIGVTEPYPGFHMDILTKYLKAEDDFILKGIHSN